MPLFALSDLFYWYEGRDQKNHLTNNKDTIIGTDCLEKCHYFEKELAADFTGRCPEVFDDRVLVQIQTR